MSPEAIARIVNAAREFCAAEKAYADEGRAFAPGWQERIGRLDAAAYELRASCGYEVEQ